MGKVLIVDNSVKDITEKLFDEIDALIGPNCLCNEDKEQTWKDVWNRILRENNKKTGRYIPKKGRFSRKK